MTKIIILDGACAKQSDLDFSSFNSLGEVTYYDRTKYEEASKRISDAEIIITNKVNITKDVIDACPNLKFISVLATGYNIIDCDYAKEKGIIVSNVPAYSTDSVVQHTFALLLEMTSFVATHNNAVKNGAWMRNTDFCFCLEKLVEISGKTLGIIGYGAIGKKVAAVAEAFGMKVLINTRTPVKNCVDLQTVLSQSDFITIHCPLTATNSKFINEESLKNVKKHAIIINTARGGLIDEQAVADALNNGSLGGFCTDVLSIEPPKEDNPLLTAKNCIITPHIAWATREARSRLLSVTNNNIVAYLNGAPINVVNN